MIDELLETTSMPPSVMGMFSPNDGKMLSTLPPPLADEHDTPLEMGHNQERHALQEL